MTDPARWTGVEGIRAAVLRRWNDGSLLRAFALDHPMTVIDVRLRHPSSADLGEHFDAARRWVDAVVRGAHGGRAYDLQYGRIGGRGVGVTDVPQRAIVTGFAQAWQLLGTSDDADAFRRLVAEAGAEGTGGAGSDDAGVVGAVGRDGAGSDDNAPLTWALEHPRAAVSLAGQWRTVLAAYRWLDGNRGSDRYLRQVDAAGVDTKFIEHHRGPLAEMLGVSASAAGFTHGLGLAAKPSRVRLRFDPAVLGFPAGLTEASLRTDELGRLRARPSSALIVENEITYLSVPVPPGGVVLWGKGYDADQPASLAWLSDVPVRYWGDLDTHGFGILNRVRAWLPHVRSVLMDRETLLAHRDRWGNEPAPTNAALPRLDAAESGVYEDLVSDRFGRGVRLEQERIDWEWALSRLG